MIISTLTVLLVGAIWGTAGGGLGIGIVPSEEVASRIDEIVEDEDRRERIEVVARDGESLRAATNVRFGELMERFGEMSGDRENDAADFEAVVADLDLDARVSQMVDLRFRLKNELTEDEWNRLFGNLEIPE